MGGEAFKALADPTRRHILELLRTKDLTAGEIAEHFDMTKPSLSHHLNTLKTAGLVEAERDGQNIIYSLNTSVLQGLMSWFYTFTDRSEDHER
ncbi:MAG: winged helix-turn-helix transcriptional regulator [Collinsella intestinalis]|jgi:DNA-binding transcriptional ArsR family regulator|uniref:autorepressor SdpR family transcription factor n=1 Tax=Collinsella intestinalis TaxID=147207 RepID=UPI0022E49419|nr:autorepressor SdpR family transcription factor [Collinsella intestinalis]MBS6613051.1 winged helix-turn-helix transcriptional regulator [Collinsella intestinalis]